MNYSAIKPTLIIASLLISNLAVAECVRPPLKKQYDYVLCLKKGLAKVKLNGKSGFLDAQGNEVVPPIYDDINFFQEGIASIKDNFKYGFVDKNNQQIVAPQYDYVLDFSNGYAGVMKNNRWGFIDTTGNTIIAFKYKEVRDFKQGLAGVKIGKRYGFINTNGKLVIKPRFRDVTGFSEDLAGVRIGKKFGFINSKGKTVIKPRYQEVIPFNNGYAKVMQNDEWLFIDKNGKQVAQEVVNSQNAQKNNNTTADTINAPQTNTIAQNGNTSVQYTTTPTQSPTVNFTATGSTPAQTKQIFSSNTVTSTPINGYPRQNQNQILDKAVSPVSTQKSMQKVVDKLVNENLKNRNNLSQQTMQNPLQIVQELPVETVQNTIQSISKPANVNNQVQHILKILPSDTK